MVLQNKRISSVPATTRNRRAKSKEKSPFHHLGEKQQGIAVVRPSPLFCPNGPIFTHLVLLLWRAGFSYKGRSGDPNKNDNSLDFCLTVSSKVVCVRLGSVEARKCLDDGEGIMPKAMLFNIQRFSLHDGPGIRTTLFFKGCPLHCLWCHNPESQNPRQEMLYDRETCVLCGVCQEVCPQNAVMRAGDLMVTDLESKNTCKCAIHVLPLPDRSWGESIMVEEATPGRIKDRVLSKSNGV